MAEGQGYWLLFVYTRNKTWT